MTNIFLRLARPALGVVLALAAVPLAYEAAVAAASRRIANLAYVPATAPDYDAARHRLDVYQPTEKAAAPRPVVLFIHGGNWNSGSKDDFLYKTVGQRLAKNGFVGVVMSYRLSPQVLVPAQAQDCARALAWTVQHIKEYGGDPGRIVVMGHSSGGGQAALLALGSDSLLARVGLPANAVHAALLDDPAGLDMLDYLKKLEYAGDAQYLIPFSKDPAVWRASSAIYHVRAGAPPMSIYVGGETYPSISGSSRRFADRLRQLGASPKFVVVPGKKHVAMVTQLFWGGNELYAELERLAEK